MIRRALIMTGLLLAPGRTESTEAPLRVFAAASLTEAFEEAAAAFEQAHPGVDVELNFAGSQVLRTQIDQGAPADVFASADAVQADALRRSGRLEAPQIFARNVLVVVVPGAAAKVAGLKDLSQPGVKIVVAGPAVPAGRYAAEVIAKLGDAGGHGPDFAARVTANVVSHETSVRAVLSKVALGEADAGFVYRTDAASAAGKVRALEIPAAQNVMAEYPIGVVAKAGSPARARAFVAFVLADAGQAILRRHGFLR